MNNQVLSVIAAFIGSSMNNIAQALQKTGLDTPDKYRFKKWGTWAFGTCMMMAAPFIIQYATSLGGASLVGAMSGSGLIALTLFSFFVMKEKITPNELAGIGIILAASIMIGVFSSGTEVRSVMNLFSLIFFMSVITIAYVVFSVISLSLNKLAGIVLGGFAGAVAGFVTLFQKVTTSNPTHASSLFTNPFFYTWIIISLFAFLILQFSYKKDRAIRIIPSFSANFILVPVLGGVICFKEALNLFQWLGVALIVCGALVINMRSGKLH
jgi:drug/metabolite transporter (DMT)-like permease